jgi:hypothetical protein
MKPKQLCQHIVDGAMSLCLLLLMGYELIGQTNHEILGIIMLVLFLIHHLLNRKWITRIFKGEYKAYRIFQTSLVILLFVSVILQVFSGIVLSKHLFKSIALPMSASVARSIHMSMGYWGFVIMSLHLGLHWGMIFSRLGLHNVMENRVLRFIVLVICIYGIFAFVRRGMPEYLSMKTQFAFFDSSESIYKFYLDYISIMAVFTAAGHYLSKALQKIR